MEANRRLGLAVMWFATGLAIVLSIARLYVRLFMIKAYGLDDHAYMIALLPLIAGTSILTFSTTYNWGTPASDPAISSPPSIVVDTRPQPFPGMVSPQLLGVIGQGLLVLGSALAKSAVGMFQLRFVTVPWQRASIYAWMGAALGLAVAVNVSQYTVCTPAAYFWDTTISEGTCAFDFLTLFMVLSVTWVVVDLYYAVLPWLFVRQLNMPYKEKVIVLSSMSLGLLASGFGIARVVGLTHLTPNGDSNSDLLPAILDTCEYAITMICVCIPVCNPLWISWARRIFWSSSRRNRDARRQHNGRKTRAWWRRGQWRQRQQRQSLHEEAIYDGTSAGGGIWIEIGGLGGRVIRFNGGGGVVGVVAPGGKSPLEGHQNHQQQQGRGRAIYATHTIGGSEMAASDDLNGYLHASSGSGGNKNISSGARRGHTERSKNGSAIADADAESEEDDYRWHQHPASDEQQKKRRSTTAWIKHTSAKIILGSRSRDEEGHVSELELRGDAFENDRAHLYESRERRAPRVDSLDCDIETALGLESPRKLDP